MKKMKIKILFGQFYKEMYCQAVAERLFDLSRGIIQFASMLLSQIDFEINENPWKSLHFYWFSLVTKQSSVVGQS